MFLKITIEQDAGRDRFNDNIDTYLISHYLMKESLRNSEDMPTLDLFSVE